MMKNGQAQKSSLMLHNILVNNVVFNRTESYLDTNESELRFGFSAETYESEDKTTYRITTITNIDNGENKDLDIKLVMSGYFGFEQNADIKEDVKEFFIKRSTLAILFPYIRSYITNLTAQSGIKPIIMPPMNINAFIESEFNQD